jgi:hypothetical protein
MRRGRIQAVEEMPGLSDDEAVAKCRLLFTQRQNQFDGFEVWDRSRMVRQHPPHEPEASKSDLE